METENTIKVICVDINNIKQLTLNKNYEILHEFIFGNDKWVKIINDNGVVEEYLKHRFKTIEDIRNDKLTQLLNYKNGN